jgi:subtilisin-like proprotein convertase family protein
MSCSKPNRYMPRDCAHSLFALLVIVAGFAFSSSASAQSEWVRRIDDNGNGLLEPSEISDRARSFLGRFAGEYGIDLNSTNSVRRVEDAARQYFERRNRETPANTAPVVTSTIKGFGPDPDGFVIPDFATPEIKYPYTPADVVEADEALERFDRNRDGSLTFDEIDPNRWRGPSPQECDLDRDSRLSRNELAQRYARRKLLEKQEAIANQFAASRTPEVAEPQYDRWRRNSGSYEGGPRGSARADRGNRALAFSILERFDLNRNQLLEPAEMSRVGVDIVKADFNRDGRVDGEELGNYLFQEMEREGNDLSEVLPTWFFERDGNDDGQIEMAEFTDEWTPEKTDEFAKFDSNEDGIITSTEALSSKQIVGGKYANTEAKVMLPRSIVVSEIQVDEDVIIGDLNVQLSITHSNVEQLDCYLLGPEGQRIELFAGVGGSDDHFDRTVFDDEVGESVMRARPPFRGTYQPAALAKRQPSLNSFKGKNLKGLWQLMVRSSRSDRSGVLHDWSLIVTPNRESVDQLLDN